MVLGLLPGRPGLWGNFSQGRVEGEGRVDVDREDRLAFTVADFPVPSWKARKERKPRSAACGAA